MAYVNVAEWKTDQVCEWLKGLDNSVLPYVHSFSNHNVNGQQLLNLRPEDLDHLGVLKLGHQETILEAVEYLRNFHYELDRENLQLLSLRLSCLTHSLFNELSRQTDLQPVSTQTLADVATIITAVKPLVCWLDRPPFSGQLEYNDKKTELLKLSLEMATCAQRDRFAEKPIEEIRTTCGQMAKLADYIVQDIADPMILQPASLDLATLKKRPGDDLGFCILPSFHGAHQIAEIKFGSAAHQCGKMEEGDEIVQVNYQTVVGWERKNVLELFRESPAEVLLTLKRRPRHTKVYGQIYIKPYRLPSNKKTPYASRWHHNLPSPRPELLTIPDFQMPLPKHTPKENSLHHHQDVPTMIDTVDMMLDTITTDSSNDSDSEIESPSSVRLYLAKPRNTVQRRATITGASPTTKHSIDIERFWRELKQEHNSTFQLRDKAASCAHGLNQVQSRPQTCLGIEQQRTLKSRNSSVFSNDEEKIPNDRETTIVADCDSKVPLEKKSSRGELEKCHSTPAYDFLIENKKNNLQFPDSSEVKIVIGSVVQKINNFEKHLIRSNEKIYCERGEKSERSERSEKREKILSIEEKYSPPKVPAKKSPRGLLSERVFCDEGGKIIEGEEREKREKRERNEEKREKSEEKENRERKERRKRKEGEKLEKYEENWERNEEKRVREEKWGKNEEKRGKEEKWSRNEEKRATEEKWARNEEKWAKNEEERVKEENWGKNEEKRAKNEEKRVKEEKLGKSEEKQEKEGKLENFEEKEVKRMGKMEQNEEKLEKGEERRKSEERQISEEKLGKSEERRVEEENWGRNEERRAKDEEIERNEENWRKRRGKMEKYEEEDEKRGGRIRRNYEQEKRIGKMEKKDETLEKRREKWASNEEERVNEEKMVKSEEKRVKSEEKVMTIDEKVAKSEEKRVNEEKMVKSEGKVVKNEEKRVKEEKVAKSEERRVKEEKFSRKESNVEKNEEKRAKEEKFPRNEPNFEKSEERRAKEEKFPRNVENFERSEERRAKEEKFPRNEQNFERSEERRAKEEKFPRNEPNFEKIEEKRAKEGKFSNAEEKGAKEEKFSKNEERRAKEEKFLRNELNFERNEERRAKEDKFSRNERNFEKIEEKRAKEEKFPRNEANFERSEERRAKEEKFPRNEANFERSEERRAKEEKFPRNEPNFEKIEEKRAKEEKFPRNEVNFERTEERRAKEEKFPRNEANFPNVEEKRAKEEKFPRNEPNFERSEERRAKSEEKFSKNEANSERNEEKLEKNRERREKMEKNEEKTERREKTRLDVERDRKRPEVKPRLCPPEPPPRKYFSKPKVPERPRKDLHTEDAKFSETFTDFANKSTDFPNKLTDFSNKSTDFEEKSVKSLNSTAGSMNSSGNSSNSFENSRISIDNSKNSSRSDKSLKNPNSICNSMPGDSTEFIEQTALNLGEKSFEFIDELPVNFDFKNSTLDAYGYSQIYDSQEEKMTSTTERFNDSRISTLDSRTSNDSASRIFDSRISDESASRTLDSRTSDESSSRLSNESSSRNFDSRDLRILGESRQLESRILGESRTLDSRMSNESRLSDSRFDSRTLDSRIYDSRFSGEARNFPRDSRTLDARFSESRFDGRSESRFDGRNESRYEARNESWNESRNEGRTESRNEGRTESRTEGRTESRNEGRSQNLRTPIESQLRMENALLDSTDGAGCSRQQEKPRTLEKDRGVVNRAMMVARSIGFNTSKTLTSPKTSRKRNMALAKRRNISAKELTPNDLEGWLIYRSRGAGGAWAKAWFVLKGSSLFRFKTQESPKADCLIALAGFTASQASEVKSRKHAFKVYHTGTVFYFAADTDDSLLTWLDAVSKTTVGADVADRSSGLFSETDESDGESCSRNSKLPNSESGKVFGSLKKSGKKEQSLPTGASLDRKYLKFLGKSQNVPVPTAQFRSYRRVLPSSTPRKQDSISNSPELPVTVAGSTFYGLNASRSANDVPSSSQDMGDYRRTSDRFPRTRRNDELQGFITLEEFMLSRQDDDHHHHQQQQNQLHHHQQQQQQQQQNRGTPSPRFTPLTSDHVHVQHRTFDNLESARMRFARDIPNNNGVIYGFPKNYDETSSTSGGSSYGMQTPSHTFERRASEKTRDSESKNSTPRTLNCMRKKKSPEDPYYDSRLEQQQQQQQQLQQQNRTGAHGQINPANYGCEFIGNEFRVERNNSMDFCSRRIAKNDVYSGSSGDLASHSTDTFKVQKPTVSRNGSFNLADCRRDKNHHHHHQEKKMNKFEKNKLKHVGQYQPPPILNTPFEQEGMRAAFEMHLDKSEDVQKKNKLKNFFSNKSPQKPSALEIPKETQKTLLGSPRLHRALFRDKSSTQPKTKRSGSQSPGDSGISQSLSSGSASQSQTLSQSYSSVSSVSDWSPDTPASHGPKCPTGHPGCQKRSTNSRNFTSPPTLPYIPPPTSPPPDYPGLEYPPVFEPGTYSLSDASSILRSRNNKNS